MTSSKPKVQKKMHNSFKARAGSMRAPLSKELRAQYKMRTASLRKGDTVTVTGGDYKGHEGKVTSLITSETRITMEGVNTTKMDGTSKPVMLYPSRVTITKLDLSDKERKKALEKEK